MLSEPASMSRPRLRLVPVYTPKQAPVASVEPDCGSSGAQVEERESKIVALAGIARREISGIQECVLKLDTTVAEA